ncbi:hypothetical protein Vi05172_g13039 [Venturia inaequalis]|uniref:Uncharacterized protein n=1 Tax=Venturia inaequalis TaxID=5025 RepID=A0A8H3ZAY1_VENIN|nr:hypothetical protein EG327_007709 [Venturia inaequalis]RDI76938.1 hypothetical protein Vi05172_g13039 [Venturia inaequalis]
MLVRPENRLCACGVSFSIRMLLLPWQSQSTQASNSRAAGRSQPKAFEKDRILKSGAIGVQQSVHESASSSDVEVTTNGQLERAGLLLVVIWHINWAEREPAATKQRSQPTGSWQRARTSTSLDSTPSSRTVWTSRYIRGDGGNDKQGGWPATWWNSTFPLVHPGTIHLWLDIQTVVKESGTFEKALDIRGHGAMRQAARTSHRPLFACISLARHHTASAMSADVKSIGNSQEKSNRETQE